MSETPVSLETLVSLCKRRGIIFPGSEIYGGLANTWDYGPVGVELKNNIKKVWWKYFVQEREDMVGLDGSILMNPKVWKASGHLTCFSDPLMDCKNCKERVRGDKLIEKKLGVSAAAGETLEEISKIIKEHNIPCPKCGVCDFTEARTFNLMFKTYQGVLEDTASLVYLRPETAQGIFVNFKNVLDTTRKRLPFGIAQIGKAFRNEITPGNFTFRTCEFEQMEIEYFVKPGDEGEWFEKWKKEVWNFYITYGIKKEYLRYRDHTEKELSHYSNNTTDIEYKFPWGWGELFGLASRTDFDLTQHRKFSGNSLEYLDPETNEKFIPYVVEPSFGCDRTVLTFLFDAYDEEKLKNGESRVVMRFHKDIAPIKIAVLPLSRKQELSKIAYKVGDILRKDFVIQIDETQSIGKRYRRQDEIGTPYCVTIDFDTLEDESVTIRERDSMKQERVKIETLREKMIEKFAE